MRALYPILIFSSLQVFALDHRFAKWSVISDPAAGAPQVIGAYSAGCLIGATQLPLEGSGFALMRPSRRRFFAHPDLSDYLKNLTTALKKKALPFLLVGDASPPRGGPMASGHNSHQTGLDIDIWLNMSSSKPTRRQRESWSAPRFVRNRKTLLKNWSSTQVKLVSTVAQFDSVSRIFVAPAIKKYFCVNSPSAPWLYRLRAWWGHEEHIHVRLNCPANNSTCEPQSPLDANDSGCGEELDWWYSKEADEEWTKIKADPSEREFPSLPESCATAGPI